MNSNQIGNCFDEFKDISPKRKEPTIQILYEYEKHYLELVKRYSKEIQFIENMLSDFRKEQEIFYGEKLPNIINKLSQDAGIDEEMKKVWLNRLTINIERSFLLSETLILEMPLLPDSDRAYDRLRYWKHGKSSGKT